MNFIFFRHSIIEQVIIIYYILRKHVELETCAWYYYSLPTCSAVPLRNALILVLYFNNNNNTIYYYRGSHTRSVYRLMFSAVIIILLRVVQRRNNNNYKFTINILFRGFHTFRFINILNYNNIITSCPHRHIIRFIIRHFVHAGK